MITTKNSLRGLILIAAIALSPDLLADCESPGGCSNCRQPEDGGTAVCETVLRDGSCECGLNVSTPRFCILEGNCQYTGSGGGGGGILPGGGGGGGGGCTVLPGEVCPVWCMSCTIVYWY